VFPGGGSRSGGAGCEDCTANARERSLVLTAGSAGVRETVQADDEDSGVQADGQRAGIVHTAFT